MNAFPDSPVREVRVGEGARSYSVAIGVGVLDRTGAILRSRFPRARRAVLVVDAGLPGATADRARTSLAAHGFTVGEAPCTADEAHKSLRTVESLLDCFMRHRLERAEPVIALGGGVVGDVAGFAAAIYRRGVPVLQCPTTLLAMVDSSVGGKTGVNLADADGLRKNMAGAFHPPLAVLADVALLDSLPMRQFRSGLAECVKHGVIGGPWGEPALLAWLRVHAASILAREPGTLAELVERNVRLKAAVVGSDEREEADQGGRALLNLGHTFGHAIETLSGARPHRTGESPPLLHGEAVAIGLIAACMTSIAVGCAPPELLDSVRSLLTDFGLPTQAEGLPSDDVLLERMRGDKKVLGGRLRLVLPSGPSTCRIVPDPPEAAVRAGLAAMRA
ncbi:MAG: 3-dehydroquinate synthase [Phycisphaerae bacterium]|nr:3-dehydroquinate synthase [Phycisphaerae bacterium]